MKTKKEVPSEIPVDPSLKYQCALATSFDAMAKDGIGLTMDQKQVLIDAVRKA